MLVTILILKKRTPQYKPKKALQNARLQGFFTFKIHFILKFSFRRHVVFAIV